MAQADQRLDFGRFDNDGPDGEPNSGDDDGIVDYIFINTLTAPRNFIRGGATGIAGLGFVEGLYRTDDHAAGGGRIRISADSGHGALLRQGSFALTVGIMAHEFGHAFGLPDLYDLSFDNPASDSAGIGRWGLMGNGTLGWKDTDGPTGFSAWSLEQLGWIGVDNQRLVEVWDALEDRRLEDLFQQGHIYKVYLPPAPPLHSSNRNQPWLGPLDQGYLLLETRVRQAHHYNRNIPGEGLLVWHVTPAAGNNSNEGYKRVDLVCADGLYNDAGFPLGRHSAGTSGFDNLDFWAHDSAYRKLHNGNQGDATDPFDGVRFTELHLDSNPSAAALGNFSPKALSALELKVVRRGGALRLDLAPPRWSGAINGNVAWSGSIAVSGDLQIGPQATLYIKRGSRVVLAPGDDQRGGRDPQQIEVDLRGRLEIVTHFSRGGPVVFQSARPEAPWYGIAVDLGAVTGMVLPAGSLVLENASRGLELLGTPDGSQGLTMELVGFNDRPAGFTAGNGDGQLQPGESFELELEAANWTLSHLGKVVVRVGWDEAYVRPTWSDGHELEFSTDLTLVSAGKERIRLPVLTLAAEVSPGDPVEFKVELEGGGVTYERSIRLPVAAGPRPADPVQWTLIDPESVQAPRLLTTEDSAQIEVQVGRGPLVGGTVVARDLTSGAIVAEIPLTRRGDTLQGLFSPPQAGRYQLRPRLRSVGGAVRFADETQTVAALFEKWHPVLVGYSEKRTARGTLIRLTSALEAQNLEANFLDLDQESNRRSLVEDEFFDRYANKGHMLVWLYDRPEGALQQGLDYYLDRGGHLVVLGSSFHVSLNPTLKLRDRLGAAEVVWAGFFRGQGGGPDQRAQL